MTVSLNLYKLLGDGRINEKFTGENLVAHEVANFLRQQSISGALKCIWFHVPNEGKRSQRAGAIAKALGLIPGAPDLVFLAGDKAACIELKGPDGVHRPTQKAFASWCEAQDVPYMVCSSVVQVEATLRVWGLLA